MQKNNYGIICDVGGKGKGNQDSAFFSQFDIIIAPGASNSKHFAHEVILAIVCDGVSGSQKGEEGSTFVIRRLSSKIINYLITENFSPALIQQKLENFIQDTNTELLSKYKDLIEKGKIPKTTLVGILVIGQWLWCFNLGDSRAYLIKDTLIAQVSVDHLGNSAHEITEAMGELSVHPEIRVYNWAFENNKKAFENEYYFLICSDGLTDVVDPEEIKLRITNKGHNSIQTKIEELYFLAMEKKVPDNISIIAVNLSEYFKHLSEIQILKLS